MSFLTEPPLSLTSLASEIGIQAAVLQNYLDQKDGTQPTFTFEGIEEVLPLEAPPTAHEARAKLMDAAYKMYQLATGPSEYMATVRANYQTSSAVHWLLHFNIPALVPQGQAMRYQYLAEKAKVPEDRLRSVTRMAMTTGFFAESDSDSVAHTSVSRYFARDPDRITANLLTYEVSFPISLKMAAATERWPGSALKNQTAQNLAHGHDLSFFEFLSQNPRLQHKFALYMQSLARGQGMNNKHLVDSFQIDELPTRGLVVDVGGSMGHCSVALAEAYPDLEFEVQDLIADDDKTKAFVQNQDAHTRSRIRLRKHDFFDPQPVTGAEVYLLRMILHDWPDDRARDILQRVGEAMGDHSVIAVMDTVLPRPGSIPGTSERQLRLRDLAMQQNFNSKERTLQDWEGIVASATPSLAIRRVYTPLNSELAMIVMGLDNVSE